MQCIIEKAKPKELWKVNKYMSISIQKATIADLNNIYKLELELKYSILSYDILASTLDNSSYYYFVAKINNLVVGYLAAEFMVDHFDILAIAVAKEYRLQNIATLLVSKLFSTCLDLKIKDIFLEVRENNIDAIAFYEKLKFAKIHMRKGYYTDTGESAYIYYKSV